MFFSAETAQYAARDRVRSSGVSSFYGVAKPVSSLGIYSGHVREFSHIIAADQ
jgi:hypothetical protein